jgi:hypothetical protein
MTIYAASSGAGGLTVFVGFALFMVAGIILSAVYEKKRREEFQRVAQNLGFQFPTQSELPSASPSSCGLELFSLGRSGAVSNLLKTSVRGVEISLFDYQYVTGSGKNRTTHRQTVAMFFTPDAILPAFTLRPENIFHRIGSAFGYQDIDFSSHPKFSKNYLLRSPDEAGVRALFNDQALEYFENQPEFCVEAAVSSLIVFRHHHRVKPENLEAFLETGLEVLAVLGAAHISLQEFSPGAPDLAPGRNA